MQRPIKTVLLRAFLRTFGRLSDGIRLCLRDGPAAGTTLAYAYRNQPRGQLLLGKYIDRRFLNYPGWQRARERLAAVEQTILTAATQLRADNLPIHILDLASGPADYLFNLLERHALPAQTTALCRDTDPHSLRAGQQRAAELQLPAITFQPGSALDREPLLALTPKPTLILSVGFYELLADNHDVRNSIAIAAETLAPGGLFLLVHQLRRDNNDMASQLFPDKGITSGALTFRTIPELSGYIQQTGLTITHTAHCAANWYGLLLARKDPHGPRPL